MRQYGTKQTDNISIGGAKDMTPMKQNYISYMRLFYIFSTLIIRVLKFTIYSTFRNTKCYIAAYNNNCQKERQRKTKRRKEMVPMGRDNISG